MCQRHYKTHLPGLACTIAFAAVLLLAGSAPLYGQTRPAPPPPPPPDDKVFRNKDDLGSDIGSHEGEMRAKLARSRHKKLYDENPARTPHTAEMASQLI